MDKRFYFATAGMVGVALMLGASLAMWRQSANVNGKPAGQSRGAEPGKQLGYERPRGVERLPSDWKDSFNGKQAKGYEVGTTDDGRVAVRVTLEDGETVEFKLDRDYASTLGIMMKEDADHLAR